MREIPSKYFRSFRLGRLYFRFIRGTELENQGWTAERLAKRLADAGLIEILTIQPHTPQGRWGKAELRYIERAGITLTSRMVREVLTQEENVS